MFSREDLQSKIIEKAWSDEEFKKALISNPKGAVKDAFGIDISDDITITVCEETENHFYLIIPQNPALPGFKNGIMW